MRGFRYTLGRLGLAIVWLAIGLAAARDPGELWNSITFSLASLMMLAAALLAIHRRGPTRAFWLGFALIGTSYLVMANLEVTEPRLITSRLLTSLDVAIADGSLASWTPWNSTSSVKSISFSPEGRYVAPSASGEVKLRVVSTGRAPGVWTGRAEHSRNIGHALLALLFGAVGGVFSRRLSTGRTAAAIGA